LRFILLLMIVLLQGYYRRGTAHLALNKLKLARADFRYTLETQFFLSIGSLEYAICVLG
jgi:hypothetical protein